VILTVDLGTSVTKVALWDREGLVALSEREVGTVHPAPGRSEQNPSEWWTSVVESCAELRSATTGGFGSVEVVGCTGARQTLALVDDVGEALGPAILWSDRRAAAEAAELTREVGVGHGSPAQCGILIDAGSVAAKIAWLARHEGERFEASTWIMTPRDLVVWWLTGEVVTDVTMASRSGVFDVDGRVVGELVGDAYTKLPRVVLPDHVVSGLAAGPAATLGVAAGTPVVIGAADRPSEVLGLGATETAPMVSWGTTANVSVPIGERPVPPPGGVVVSRGADGGWLLEGGLSAAGSLLAWLGRLTGRPPAELASLAHRCPPGACGVVATPWLDGARAPWWRTDAGGALVGLGSAHGPGELARAAFESVAWDVRRCLEAAASRRPPGPPVVDLVLGGRGAAIPVWVDVVGGVTGLPVRRRRSGQAASAGAAMVAARAVGIDYDLDLADPVVDRVEPDVATAALYAGLRARVDGVAEALIGLAGSSGANPSPSTTALPGA
jgi:sugar (pentulose or hexulose) kinase